MHLANTWTARQRAPSPFSPSRKLNVEMPTELGANPGPSGSVHLHLTANCADAMEIVYRAKPEYLATSAMYADKDDTLLTVAEYEHVNSILGRLDQQIEEAQTELAIQRFILLNIAETGVRRNYLKGLVDRNFDLQLDLHDSFQGANGAIDELHL